MWVEFVIGSPHLVDAKLLTISLFIDCLIHFLDNVILTSLIKAVARRVAL